MSGKAYSKLDRLLTPKLPIIQDGPIKSKPLQNYH